MTRALRDDIGAVCAASEVGAPHRATSSPVYRHMSAVLLAAAATPLLSGTSDASDTGKCPKSDAVVLKSSKAQVYWVTEPGRARTLRGCAFAAGRPRILGSTDVFPPPAIDLDETLVTYASVSQFGAEDEVIDFVSVSLGSGKHDTVASSVGGAGRIGSLRFLPPDSIAYIICFPDYGSSPHFLDKNPPWKQCSSRGRADKEIVVQIGRGERRVIARGRTIASTSLRQAASVISWTQAGRRMRTTFER